MPDYAERSFEFTDPEGSVLHVGLSCYETLPPDEALGLLRGDDCTGQLVWSGAELLSRYIVEHPALVRGKTVVELGSGSGLVGIVCWLLGADVLLTDGSEVSLELLHTNVQKVQHRRPYSPLRVEQLRWGPAQCFERFDVVVAADCLYSLDTVPLLFQSACGLLDGISPPGSSQCGGTADAVPTSAARTAAAAAATKPRFLLAHYPRGWDAAANARIMDAIWRAAADHSLQGRVRADDASHGEEQPGCVMEFEPLPPTPHTDPPALHTTAFSAPGSTQDWMPDMRQ